MWVLIVLFGFIQVFLKGMFYEKRVLLTVIDNVNKSLKTSPQIIRYFFLNTSNNILQKICNILRCKVKSIFLSLIFP